MYTELKIHTLINAPEKWCQRKAAMTAKKTICNSLSDKAVSWCLVGAIHRCYLRNSRLLRIIGQIRKDVGTRDLVQWNDNPKRTWIEVYDMAKRLNV